VTLIYGGRKAVACFLKQNDHLLWKKIQLLWWKFTIYFIDNKQLEISTAKQDCLSSPSDMLRSNSLNAIVFSKERKDCIKLTLNYENFLQHVLWGKQQQFFFFQWELGRLHAPKLSHSLFGNLITVNHCILTPGLSNFRRESRGSSRAAAVLRPRGCLRGQSWARALRTAGPPGPPPGPGLLGPPGAVPSAGISSAQLLQEQWPSTGTQAQPEMSPPSFRHPVHRIRLKWASWLHDGNKVDEQI